MREAGATLRLSHDASSGVERTADGFALTARRRRGRVRARWWSPRGGKSIPKMGATGFGYDLAARFGLPVTRDPARPWCR